MTDAQFHIIVSLIAALIFAEMGINTVAVVLVVWACLVQAVNEFRKD